MPIEVNLPPTNEHAYLAYNKCRDFLRSMYIEGAHVKSSRLHPFSKKLPPVGTWRLDELRGNYRREISVLVNVDPWGVVGVELDSKGRLDSDRYCTWMLEGL